MHCGLAEICGFDWLERSRAHVEIDRRDERAPLVNLGEKVGREMQARRRRGDAAIVRGVYRLIPFGVRGLWRPFDIGRQWYLAVLRECSARVEWPDESDATQSAAQDLNDLDCTVVAERDAAPGFQLPARMPHGQPRTVGQCADH